MMLAALLLSAALTENPPSRTVPCQDEGMYLKQAGCVPVRCGSIVDENVLSEEEVLEFRTMVKKGFTLGEVTSSAGILDLQHGAVSYKDSFLNYHKMAHAFKEKGKADMLLTRPIIEKYKVHIKNLAALVEREFGLHQGTLRLAAPSFISQLTPQKHHTVNDEYWHTHTDTEQYGSFVFTTLTYLSSQGSDFEGGSLVMDGEPIVPRAGMVIAFTSGKENPHNVEKVTSGTRYAMTTAFTCQGGTPLDSLFADLPLQDDIQDEL